MSYLDTFRERRKRRKTQRAIKKALKGFAKDQGIDPKKAMLVAGGAMYMHGMRDDVNDIDFFHDDLPDFVKAPYGRFDMDGGPGQDLPASAKKYKVMNGIRVQTPEAMLAFYQRLNRPKDQSKIKMLKEHIKTAGVVVNIIDYIEERGLTKVAKSLTPSATELSLKTNPTGYGIHAKREGVSHRGLAVTQGVPAAIAAGIPLGALGGAFTEGANTNLLTEKGRKKIAEGYRKDLKTLGSGLGEEYLRQAALNPREELAKYLAGRVSGNNNTEVSRLAKNIGDISKRRAGLAGKGILSGMALAGGVKGLINLGQYEASRALAPHKEAKKHKGLFKKK